MSDEDGRSEYDRQALEDARTATMFRLDVEKLKALRRAASGTTRCPNCDKVNPAQNRVCDSCGSRLYPAEEEREETWKLKKGDDAEDPYPRY